MYGDSLGQVGAAQPRDLQASLHRKSNLPFGNLPIGVGDLNHELVATARKVGRGDLDPVTQDLAFFSHALSDVEFEGAIHNFQGFPINFRGARREAAQVNTDWSFDRAR